MSLGSYFAYLLVMAGVAYLVRAIPFLAIRKKIQNRFINSFMFYIPYAVLYAMTFPAIFESTGSTLSAAAGTVLAVILALCGQNLLVVALASCAAVFLTGLIF